jgi:hypothetical protein
MSMNKKTKIALLKLFNAVLVEDKDQHPISEDVMSRTIKNGYVLSPIVNSASVDLDLIEKVIGISGEKANASFHKSWDVIKSSSEESLVIQQIIHYITTYGFEDLGIFKHETVYIPNEVLEVPEIKSMPLIVVKGLLANEVLGLILGLGCGVALSEDVLDDIMLVVSSLKFDSSFVEGIKNRELKVRLMEYYGICPSDPVEYLRYVITKLTGESLLIKNSYLIEKISCSDGDILDEMLNKAPQNLASIFLRFKPIFLAMKKISRNKTFFNRLRKQAKTQHEPMPEDFLNSVTSKIKSDSLDLGALQSKLSSASIFRKIRLAYALKYRLNSPESIVYRVRNGRGWADGFSWDESLGGATEEALNVVLESIANGLKSKIEGVKFYVPECINYTLPATEKQFTGNFPTGSHVLAPEEMIVGIHWTNTENRRIDIDLSLVDVEGKIGWDGYYRNSDILFSGDVTDAPKPKGASELFHIQKAKKMMKVLVANYYNFDPNDPVDCKIIVANKGPKKLTQNFMVDPNDIVAQANVQISKAQNVLGLVANVDGQNKVYFSSMGVGNSISSYYNDNTEKTLNYLISSLVNSISLSDILISAGGIVESEKPVGEFIDLSPESLDKSTILNLLYLSE